MSFANNAIGRWLRSLGAPPADFTPEQVRRILHDVAGLREYNATGAKPAGFTIHLPTK